MERLEPLNIPPGAKLVNACGRVSLVSLSDEYDPSPEQYREFVEDMRALDQRERQQAIDDRNIRL